MEVNPQQLFDQQRSLLLKQFNHALRAPGLKLEDKQRFLEELQDLVIKIEESTRLCKPI